MCGQEDRRMAADRDLGLGIDAIHPQGIDWHFLGCTRRCRRPLEGDGGLNRALSRMAPGQVSRPPTRRIDILAHAGLHFISL
jgi:hypothetical protein